ncbi:MAG: hypothetical protein EA353_04940 [Puniceicoccaceae bacterium]|nr:MAG: hypothetical protein EA353_04940 [Puniceicoccaceae bacterium]
MARHEQLASPVPLYAVRENGQVERFGELIANTDMHFGNLSYFLPDEAPYPLAPVYDMLPMQFPPAAPARSSSAASSPPSPNPKTRPPPEEKVAHASSVSRSCWTRWTRSGEARRVTASRIALKATG